MAESLLGESGAAASSSSTPAPFAMNETRW